MSYPTKNNVPDDHNTDDEDLEDTNDAFVMYKRVVSTTTDVYMGEEIEDNRGKYAKLLYMLNTQTPNNAVVIHLASYGGSCHQGFQLCHALKNCKAKTKVIAEANCYSMGAILALCADALEVLPGGYLMFHNYSGHTFGKGGEQTIKVKEYNRHFKTTLEHFASPFLSDDEIVRLVNDQDFYIHANASNIKRRLKQHFARKV